MQRCQKQFCIPINKEIENRAKNKSSVTKDAKDEEYGEQVLNLESDVPVPKTGLLILIWAPDLKEQL